MSAEGQMRAGVYHGHHDVRIERVSRPEAEGDKVLRFPNSSLKDGQEVQTAAEAKPSLVVEK